MRPLRRGLGLGLGLSSPFVPVAFIPSQLAGLLMWGTVEDLAGTPDGTAIGNVPNRANAAKPLNTIIGGSPTYKLDSGNGKPGLQLAAGTKAIRTSATFPITTLSMFMVLRGTDNGTQNSFVGGMDNGVFGAGGRTCLLMLGANNSATNPLVDIQCDLNGGAIKKVGGFQWGWVNSATYFRSRVHMTGVSATTLAYKNGAQIWDAGTSIVACANAANFMLNYSTVSGQGGFNGYAAEWLVYSPVLSAADEALVETYLAAKWQ